MTTAPKMMLTERPNETPRRVAAVLRYLATCAPPVERDSDDVRFGYHVLLNDLAALLDWSQERQFARVAGKMPFDPDTVDD
jgi:hypothetical protein